MVKQSHLIILFNKLLGKATMKRYILPLLIVPSIAFPQMEGDDPEGEIGMPPPPSLGGDAKSGAPNDGPMNKDKKDKLAMASPDEINDKNFPELIDSFDYNNAEITDVIKAISELTGKNFIIDPAVRGKITIIAPTKISVAEAYRAFLSALAINGYTVVPSGGFLKVKSSRNAQRDNIDTYSGTYFPNSDQMITRIIHLKHISAEQVSRELRILNSKDGELSPYPQTNSLILSDYGSNIERVMKIISQLDVPGFEEKLVVIPIKYAKAKDMAELVNKIVNKDSSSSKGGPISAGVPRFGGARPTQGGSGSAYFMVIPDDRTNTLIVVGNTSGIDRIRKLLSQLDFKIRLDENGGVYVYYVKNGEAEKIAQTLNGIAKENKPATGSAGPAGAPPIGPAGVAQTTEIFGGDVKIAADKETNSLIVTASKQDYEVVLNLLSKIDIPRDQVYVEAIIMEMILEDSAKWGVGYFKYDAESKGVGRMGFNGLGSDLQAMMNPTGGEGAILAFGSKGTVPVTIGGATTNIPDLVGFINFLKGIGRTNILSTPQIMALDNEDAEIEVGDEVATSLQTSTGANGVTQTSATFKDATLKLKIKPFISPAADTIRMKIEQKIAQPKAKGEIPNTLTIAKRSITTNIVVPDGDTAVLGGLVKDEEQESVTKVPILGDIPILGWLFKSRKITKNKANLLVFITPKIIRNIEDSSKLLGKKLDQRLNFIKQNGGRDPYGKVVDDLPRRQASASSRGVKDSSEPIRSKNKVDSQPMIDTNSESEIKVESDLKSEDDSQSEDGKVVE
jgi:general secretion pathway protein D